MTNKIKVLEYIDQVYNGDRATRRETRSRFEIHVNGFMVHEINGRDAWGTYASDKQTRGKMEHHLDILIRSLKVDKKDVIYEKYKAVQRVEYEKTE